MQIAKKETYIQTKDVDRNSIWVARTPAGGKIKLINIFNTNKSNWFWY